MGTAAAGPRPSRRSSRRSNEALQSGTSFGAPTEREIELAEPISRDRALHRNGAAGELGHRSHHVRHPGGARIHGARPDRQVRRLLSRARGFPAGESGLGRGHARLAGFARRSEGFSDTTIALPFNSVDAVERGFQRTRQPDRRGDRGAGGGQHGLRAAARPAFSKRCAKSPRARAPADLRRSDDRLPRGIRRRAATLRHPPRSHHAGQSHRRRLADRRLWRAARHHEPGGAGGTDLPGRHALGKPSGRGRRAGHVALSEIPPGDYDRTGCPHGRHLRRRPAWHYGEPCRIHVYDFLHRISR